MNIKRDKLGRWDKNNESGKRFTREHSLGNQHAKGNKPNATSFKVGEHVQASHPSWKGGIQRPKNDCVHVSTGANKRMRRPRFVWESVYGALPKGYVLYHRDGDKLNDDINNLEAITRAELVARNNHRII